MINTKILVTYASRRGSTAEIAAAIADVLRDTGAKVDVRSVRDVHNLIGYRAVVIGSAIYDGGWLPEAMAFTHEHEDILSQLPVAYFLATTELSDESEEQVTTIRHYLEPVYATAPHIHPLNVGLFAASFAPGMLQRVRLVFTGSPYGDFRNWEKIREWAAHLRPMLVESMS